MASARWTRMLAVIFLAGCLGCDGVVKVDVECQQVCLATPGPTLPALATALSDLLDGGMANGLKGPWDANLSGVGAGVDPVSPSGMATLEWVADMGFNTVLAQLPGAAAGISAEVHLSSVSLASTTSLDFIESLEVVMSHSGSVTTKKASGSSVSSVQMLDGGAGAGAGVSCREAGVAMRVAYFQRDESAASGSTIDLIMVNPGLDVFDCLKDEPTQFKVKLAPRPGYAPASDAPLTLGTCIGASTHAKFP